MEWTENWKFNKNIWIYFQHGTDWVSNPCLQAHHCKPFWCRLHKPRSPLDSRGEGMGKDLGTVYIFQFFHIYFPAKWPCPHGPDRRLWQAGRSRTPVLECPMFSFQCTSLLSLCCIVPVQGSLEMFSGLGLILGPPLGGWMYQAYGYELPFLVLGCILLLMVPFNIIVMPSCGDVHRFLYIKIKRTSCGDNWSCQYFTCCHAFLLSHSCGALWEFLFPTAETPQSIAHLLLHVQLKLRHWLPGHYLVPVHDWEGKLYNQVLQCSRCCYVSKKGKNGNCILCVLQPIQISGVCDCLSHFFLLIFHCYNPSLSLSSLVSPRAMWASSSWGSHYLTVWARLFSVTLLINIL